MARYLIFGANSAMAEAYIKKLAVKENEFVLVARNKSKLEDLMSEIKQHCDCRIELFVWDALEKNSLDELLGKIFENKKVDQILLAYGLLGQHHEAERLEMEAQKIIDVNFLSVMHLIESLKKHLNQQECVLSVITSVAGERPRSNNYYYATAKGALSLYLSGVRSASEFSRVKIIDVRPGYVESPMTQHMKKGVLWAKPEQVAQDLVKATKKNCKVIYTPFFWRWIMFIVRHLPQKIFQKIG